MNDRFLFYYRYLLLLREIPFIRNVVNVNMNISVFLMDFLAVILAEIIGGIVFVLLLNPRLGAARIKKEILEDREFVKAFLNQLFSDDFASILDGEYEKLRRKLWGTMQSYTNAGDLSPVEIKELKGDTALDIMEQNPDLREILGMFPRLERKIKKNPNYIYGFLQYGLPFIEKLLA